MKPSELAVAARAALAPLQALQKLSLGLNDIEQLELEVNRLEASRVQNENAIASSSKVLTDLIGQIDKSTVELAQMKEAVKKGDAQLKNAIAATDKQIAEQAKRLAEEEKKSLAEIELRLTEAKKAAAETKNLLDEEISVLTATRDGFAAEIDALKAKFA